MINIRRAVFFDWSTNSLNIKPAGQLSALRASGFVAGSRPILNDTKDMVETSFPLGTSRVTFDGSAESRQRETIVFTSSSLTCGWKPDKYSQNVGGGAAGMIEQTERLSKLICLIPLLAVGGAIWPKSFRRRLTESLSFVQSGFLFPLPPGEGEPPGTMFLAGVEEILSTFLLSTSTRPDSCCSFKARLFKRSDWLKTLVSMRGVK